MPSCVVRYCTNCSGKSNKSQGVTFHKVMFLQCLSGQALNKTVTCNGICGSRHCVNLSCLRTLKNCVVIVGNLTLTITVPRVGMFNNTRFENLREITGYMAISTVPFLDSIGQLFPNLVRIRGRHLFHDYALIIHDNLQLNEIGLFSLLKIDRGGVVIWGSSDACYVDTVDWNTIAPRYRHVISPPDDMTMCNKQCTCSRNTAYNYCWNNMKCQRFLEGSEAMNCDAQCLGCRLTDPKQCWLCRHYTHNNLCVTQCPNNTVILEDNQYCITEDECFDLGRWVWNSTCISSCPDDYEKKNTYSGVICHPCPNCTKYCGDLVIRTLSSIQEAHRCVYINGSLIIHIRGVPEALEEMRIHLNRIQVVQDFIEIHDSISISSVDFLPSLQCIEGKKLVDGKYSLLIRDNPNLQTVFMPNVTKKLVVKNGTIGVIRNPMLCLDEINELSKVFPVKPTNLDIPHGLNAYNSGCTQIWLSVNVTKVTETSATVKFVPLQDSKMHYSILYVRVPPGKHATVVPETCSDYEWHAINVPDNNSLIELNFLRPASTYLVCIESYDLLDTNLARSSIVNFSTLVGKPEPPFIVELAASSPEVVVLHWVDHLDYERHITRYEIDVSLIEIHQEDVTASDQCKNIEEDTVEIDMISRHAVVMRPPPDYAKGCESMCGVLSKAPKGALVEDNFDVCDFMESACNEIEDNPVSNSSFGIFIRTFSLSIKSPKNSFQVAKLAPFRDYRFRLRACTVEKCSRSMRRVVRTLPSKEADRPTIKSTEVIPNGIVKVLWDAPVVSNGPVLAYILEIIPDAKVSDVGTLLHQTWCVPADQSSIAVRSDKAIYVRVCSLSLGSRGCTEFAKLLNPQSLTSWGWAGVLFAVPLCIVSLVIGYVGRRCQAQSDSVPLVNITSTYRTDSEPPIFSMMDFTPSFYEPHAD